MISSITEVLLQQVLRDGSSCFLQQHAEPSLAFVSFIYPVSSPRDTSCAHGDRKQRQKLGQLLQMSLYCLIPVMCWGKATDPVQRRHPEKEGPVTGALLRDGWCSGCFLHYHLLRSFSNTDVSAIEAESGFCILTSNVISETVLGEAEKNNFISLSGKGGPAAVNALKTVCPDLEGMVRSFMVMIQRGLMDILLVGLW